MVAALARRYLGGPGGDPAEIDDAVQEIFIEVWTHAARHDPAKGGEPAFIATIAHRRLIDRQRRHAARRSRVAVADADSLERSAHLKAGLASLLGNNRTALHDDTAKAAQAFSQLTSEEQEAVYLAICQGISHERVSGMLSVPLGTIKTRIRRGLSRLRDMLSTASGNKFSPPVIEGAQAGTPEGGQQ
jgi:RNA polymerase sigma-70 factor (ECF subfamily)